VWVCSEALHITSKELSGSAALSASVSAASGATVLKGLEAFTFNYRVKWPLSLVLSKRSLTKYQLLFQHLFKCKHVRAPAPRTHVRMQPYVFVGVVLCCAVLCCAVLCCCADHRWIEC
jgi:hypothetical protein